MPVPLNVAQTAVTVNLLKSYADATAAAIDGSFSFEFLKAGNRGSLMLVRSTKIQWLSDNAGQANADPVFADRWYSEAKAAEHLLQNIPGWQYSPALGTVDSALKRGIGYQLT